MKKKKSPVKVVVPLILAVAAAGVGYKVVNRYIPSKEVMDGNEYFGTSGGEDAAVVLPDRLEQGKALVKDGTAYVEYATAKENLNDHLYKSDEEQQVILTTAVDIIKLPYDSNEYTTLTGNGSMPYQIVVSQDGNVYIALDYLAQYTALQYSVEQEPLHIIINNQWGTKTFSDVIKEESVRLDADIKSPILKKEATGDKVTVLEQEEEWTKVLTADGYIGYMKSKKLSDSYEEQVTSDFRAAERTFQLLTQAAGRAGRGEKPGEVIIQTYNPEHYSVICAKNQDYNQFYEEEIFYRQAMRYPPVWHMLVVLCASKEEAEAYACAKELADTMEKVQADKKLQMIGPADAAVAKVNDIYKKVLYFKHPDYGVLIQIKDKVEQLMEEKQGVKNISVQFDFDPVNGF